MSESRLPSMTALLGLLAVAGYQNRDKIAEWLGSAKEPGRPTAPSSDMPPEAGGILGGALGAGGIGGLLNGGLGELLDRFKQAGQADKADSWVRQGPNQEVAPQEFETAIGPDVIDALVRQTGLSKEELLSRLSQRVPEAVDRYTPEGRLGAAGA
ncbi:YidB family protein [Bosea vestrisii]|uniref:YidB family protein n=1 Tax=Bosea vestrisii TaxID=151416 RepID=UPI0024DFA4FB|nr:YidB family protein [Bosea vestrisii]WID95956.1 YidB family protein [Bosea vestrisii]